MGKCLSILQPVQQVQPEHVNLEIEPSSQKPTTSLDMIPVERPQIQPQVQPQVPKLKISQLENLDPNTVPKVPLQNVIIDARIVEVYDGDTVKIIVMLGDVPFFISLRLLGIDAPEIKKGKDKLPEENLAAIKVREHIKTMFPKQMGKVMFRDWDKYGGRILGDLYTLEGINVVETLIKEGWGRPYNGEKKKEWTLKELVSPPFV